MAVVIVAHLMEMLVLLLNLQQIQMVDLVVVEQMVLVLLVMVVVVDHMVFLVVLVDHTLMVEVAAVALAELVPTGQATAVEQVVLESNCHLHSVIQDKHHQIQLTHNLI